jgi:hypothetical protein
VVVASCPAAGSVPSVGSYFDSGKMDSELEIFLEEEGFGSIDHLADEIAKLKAERDIAATTNRRRNIIEKKLEELQKYFNMSTQASEPRSSDASDDLSLEPEGMDLREIASDEDDDAHFYEVGDIGPENPPPDSLPTNSVQVITLSQPHSNTQSTPKSKVRKDNLKPALKKASEPAPTSAHFDTLLNFSPRGNSSFFQVRFFVHPPLSGFALRKVTCTLDRGRIIPNQTIKLCQVLDNFVYASDWEQTKFHQFKLTYTFESLNMSLTFDAGTIDLYKFNSRVINICSYLYSNVQYKYKVPALTQQFAFFSLLKSITSLTGWAAAFSQFRQSFNQSQNATQLSSSEYLPLLERLYQSGGERIKETVFGMLALISPHHDRVGQEFTNLTRNLLLSIGHPENVNKVIGATESAPFIRAGIENCLIYNAQTGDCSWLLFPTSLSDIDLGDSRQISSTIRASNHRRSCYHELLNAIVDLRRNPEELLQVLEVAPFPEQREEMIQSWKTAICEELYPKQTEKIKYLWSGFSIHDMMCLGQNGFPTPKTVICQNVPSLREMYFNRYVDLLLAFLTSFFQQHQSLHPIAFPFIVVESLEKALSTLGIYSSHEAWELFSKFLDHPECKWLALRVFYRTESLDWFDLSDDLIPQAWHNWFHKCARSDVILAFACAYEALFLVKATRKLELTVYFDICREELEGMCNELPVMLYLKSIEEYSSLCATFNDPHLASMNKSLYLDQWKLNLQQYLRTVENWTNILSHLGFSDANAPKEIWDRCLRLIFAEFETLVTESEEILLEIAPTHFCKFFVDLTTLLRSTQSPNSLLDHPFLQFILRQLRLFFETFGTEAVLLGKIEKLKIIPGFSSSLSLLSEIVELPLAARVFEDAVVTLKSYVNLLELLQYFLTSHFRGHISESNLTWEASDFDECHHTINHLLQTISQTPLSAGTILIALSADPSTPIWENNLDYILHLALKYLNLRKSFFFRNSISLEIKTWFSKNNSILTRDICEFIVPEALRRIGIIFNRFAHPEELPLLEMVELVDPGVTKKNLNVQMDLVLPFIFVQPAKTLILEGLTFVLSRPEIYELCGAVKKLGEFFEATDRSNFNFEIVLNACDPKCLHLTTLWTLMQEIRLFESTLSNYRTADDLYLELSRAEPLLLFSKDVAGETNLNLDDSVEHFGESAVGIGVVSDFDMVRHLLKEPLNSLLDGSQRMKLLPLLQQLSNVAMKIVRDNPHPSSHSNDATDSALLLVASRIKECNKHAYGLRSLYDQVSQRQELMKSIIISLLDSGTMHLFIRNGSCQMEAFFHDADNQKTYSTERLLDFKGRALLHINSNLIEAQGESSGSQLKKKLELFSLIISLAMESVNLLDSLLSLGHIKYPRFDQHIRFTSENLQILLEKLKVDQVKWKFALKELRDESYHFNDFFGYQIVSLQNFFMNSCSDHEINIVSNLLLSVTSGSSKIFKHEVSSSPLIVDHVNTLKTVSLRAKKTVML